MATMNIDPGRLGNWTMGFNMTQFVPSAKDLALAGPRMFMKVGSFLGVPDAVDNIFGSRIVCLRGFLIGMNTVYTKDLLTIS